MSSLPFHFELDSFNNNNNKLFSSLSTNSFSEPTSVLDSAKFPSRQASSSSLSNATILPPLENYTMEDWETVVSANEFAFAGLRTDIDIGHTAPWVGYTPHISSTPSNPSYFNQIPVSEDLYPNHMNQNQNPKIGIGDYDVILDRLFKICEVLQTGNMLLAQEILARLNHMLSPIGKPFQRAAFYFKEALQLLVQNITCVTATSSFSHPFSLVYEISAYKTYAEILPLVHFANFTSNQGILDAMEGFERIHIVDFDIGYGCKWASFMQELGLRCGGTGTGTPFLKITALVSLSSHDQLELGICRENLIQFASEVNVAFEFEVMSVDSLNSCSWSVCFRPCENEGLAVNLPVSVLYSYQVSVPLVLRFVKQLCPRVVVSVDRGCDRNDLPFANHLIHAVQSYSNLMECLDAVNVNVDALQKIEKFLFQPGIEKIVMGRSRAIEKTQHWRTLFLSSGFLPVMFSNFAETQAECVVKRSPVRGFQVEKRQGSLVLSWQRKELVSVWAWRC